MIFRGSGVALITPLNNENNVDFQTLNELVDFHLQNNTDALVVCGTTGEPSTLTKKEQIEIIKFVIKKVQNKIPIIVGTGCNNTQETISYTHEVEKLGVDGFLVITPYYNKCNNKGLLMHYEAINNSVNSPIMLYNVPSRTNVNITASLAKELSKLKNVVAIKEASGDMSNIARIRQQASTLDLYSGSDEATVPILSLGGIGTVSVVANIIPKQMSDMVNSYLNGNIALSQELQIQYIDLIDSMFCEVNPIPVKVALRLMGFNVGSFRLPLCEIDDANLEKLKNSLRKHRLI